MADQNGEKFYAIINGKRNWSQNISFFCINN